MNERIKLLADQARDWGYAEHSGYTAQLLFEEKFAELIIAECVDMFPDELSSMRDDTGKACRYMIKEHFGIN